MGFYKFKLSDMIPNAWFYKLRDMNKAKKQNKSLNERTYLSQPRRSIYHHTEPIRAYKNFNSPTNPKLSDIHFLDYPRQSSSRISKRKTVYKPSPRPSSGNTLSLDYHFSSSESSDNEFYGSHISETDSNSMESRYFFNELSSWSNSYSCRVTSSNTDIIMDVSYKSPVSKNTDKLYVFDSLTDVHLPPIVTKSSKLRNENVNIRKQSSQEHCTLSVNIVKEGSIKLQKQKRKNPTYRNSLSNSTGLKLNSPKLVNKKIRKCAEDGVFPLKQSYEEPRKKSFSKSFVIVKPSFDPQRDFRDSMVEMIVENEISDSKDLEELLACYLSLNLDEYHGVIVKAFEQIWFEMDRLGL